MNIVSELKIRELRSEISKIEDAEKSTITVVAELAEAHNAINDVERRLNLNAARKNDVVTRLENFQLRGRLFDASAKSLSALQNVQRQIALEETEIRSLTAERAQIEDDLRGYRSKIASLLEKAEGHPIYVAVRAKQAELFLQAAEIAKSAWSAPVLEVHKFTAKLVRLAETETEFVSSCLPEIRSAGLPDISPRLPKLIERLSPSFTKPEIEGRHYAASAEIRDLVESATQIERAKKH